MATTDEQAKPSEITPEARALRRVLIADDSEFTRNALRTGLNSEPGVTVCGEAENGLQTLELATRLRPDLIIIDLVMPDMNGLETAVVLRKELPKTPIILISVYETELGKPLGASLVSGAGATVAISKHEGITRILAAVRELLPNTQTPPRAAAV